MNILYKGFVGALGVLFCFVLYLLFVYYNKLFRKYRTSFKQTNDDDIKIWEIIVFAVITGFIIWWIVFISLTSFVNWRTLSDDEDAIIAFVVAILFTLSLIIPHKKIAANKSIRSNIKQFAVRIYNKLNGSFDKREAHISGKVLFQNLDQIKDAEGIPLTERLDDIYACVKAGAENMENQLVGLPPLSIQGKMEAEIIMASVLPKEIEEGIVIQALLIGKSLFNSVGITTLTQKINNYKSLYKQIVQRNHIEQSWPLLDFARNRGKLKIATYDKADTYGNKKCPIFCINEQNYLRCHFSCFLAEEQTPEYIKANKSEIYVEKRDNGDLVFSKKSDIERDKNFYFDYMAYYLYCRPLQYDMFESSEHICKELKNNGITLSSDNFIVGYAFSEGKRITSSLATSIGLVPF